MRKIGCQKAFGKRFALLMAGSMLLSACQARPSLVKPRLEGGAVFLYLQPLSSEAERLTFNLQEVSAVREDGTRLPLTLSIDKISSKENMRERILASGELPPGQYKGVSFRVKSAFLKGEGGEAALSLMEETPGKDFPFMVTRGKALVLSLTFRYKDSVLDGFRFSPSFSAQIPVKLTTGLIGLVSSRKENIVTLFDKFTGKVAGIVPMGASPAGIALDPVLRRAYVAISGEDSVEVIDLLGEGVIDRGRLNSGDGPTELVLTRDRKTLLVTNTGSNTVSFIDAASLVEIRRIRVGAGPQSVLIDRAGRRAYVFNTLSNTISIIDIGASEVAATIATEAGPVRGQFNREGNSLYVLHKYSPYLIVLDPLSLSVRKRVYVGTGGLALKVDSLTDLIYLARQGGGEITIYDPFSFLPADVFRLGGDPSLLTIDGEGNNLVIPLPGKNAVRIVHIVGKGTVSEIDVGEDPYWVALMGER